MKKMILNFFRSLCGTTQIIPLVKKIPYEVRRNQLIEHIMHCSEKGICNEKYTDHEIIVSLTTYGKRIYDVAFTIESIMQQSMKANRIILWLDYSFENRKLPEYLSRQQKRGLEICYCKDIRSYTKLVPALNRYPEAAIITVDDDALYEGDLIENLIIPYLANQQYIYCHRYHKITLDSNGKMLPYKQWKWCCTDDEPSFLNFLTGVGGVLYPPHCLDEEVKNEDVFMDICKFADDVWFNAMAIKKGTLVKRVYSRSEHCEDYLINADVQNVGLFNKNVIGDSLNDKQIEAVFTKYKLYDKLR